MALTISNRQASPFGLWDVETEYKVAPAMSSGTVLVDPTMASQSLIDLYVKAGVITAIDGTPVNTVAPAVTGTAQVGQTLALSNGTWTGTPTPTYTYEWQIGNSASGSFTFISGESGSTYIPVTGDVGKFIRGVVYAANASGSVFAFSNVTAAVISA